MSGAHNMHCSANTKCTRCGKENPAEIHTCTPLALRLAEKLDEQFPIGTAQHYLDGEAAAELRRLSALNAELAEACETLVTLPDNEDWIATLRLAVQQARSALAKAKGESNAD